MGQHGNPFPPGSALGGALQLGRGAPCPAGPASQGRRLLRQAGCGLAMPITGASALWVPGLVEEPEDAQAWS